MAEDINSVENASNEVNETDYIKLVYDLIHSQDFVITIQDIFFEKESIVDEKTVNTKINEVIFGEELILTAQCIGEKGKLEIILIEEGDSESKILGKPVVFLINGEEKNKIEFNINDSSQTYSQKINIRPKDNDKFIEINKKLRRKKDKKINIHLLAKITDNENDKPQWYNFFYSLKTIAEYLNNNFAIKPVEPIIVIDPGHGVTPGNEGAQARIYQYKLKDESGKVLKDPKGNIQTKTANVMDLPQYVIDEPSIWIIGNNDYKISKNNKLDPDRTENYMVYDVSEEIIKLLIEKGYKVINTRESRTVTKVTDSKEAIYFRTKISNDNKADYFISIHADGANNFQSGSHVIYNEKDQDGEELAKDIFTYYTVVNIESKHPSARNNVGVVGDKNNAKRKVLIELGYITSPKDAKDIYSNINIIAEQIVKGLEGNINKYF